MIKILGLLSVFMTSSLFANEEYKGKIIRNGVEEEVTFILKSNYRHKVSLMSMSGFTEFNFGIEYINSDGKKQVLLPEDGVNLEFVEEEKLTKFVSRINPSFLPGREKYTGALYVFWELVVDGNMKLFNLYGKPSDILITNKFASGVIFHDIILGPDSHTLQYSAGNLNYNSGAIGSKMSVSLHAPKKKEVAEIFKSCPDLYNKIMSEEYVNKDIVNMVEEFNNLCNYIPEVSKNSSINFDDTTGLSILNEIINKNIEALGGLEKLNQLNSIEYKAKSFINKIETSNNEVKILNDKGYKLEMKISKKKNIQVFNQNYAKRFFSIIGHTKPVKLSTEEFEIEKDCMNIRGEFYNYLEKGIKMIFKGEELFKEKQCLVVISKNPQGKVKTIYIDKDNYQILKIISNYTLKGKDIKQEVEYLNYTIIDGYTISNEVRSDMGVEKYEDIKINSEILDSTFDLED